jgi:hypothetical protein
LVGKIMNRSLTLLISLIPLVFVGCGKGDSRTPTHAVRGKVTDGSKPLAHAQVVFHPIATTAGTPKPRAKTDANGEFSLTTYDGNDGAPAGQYKVSVEQLLADPKNPDAGPTNRLPAKYADPEKSGLTATVNAGPNELPAFVVKK